MATIHVSGGGDALKNAVSGASDGDVILVADGTYNPIASNEFGSKSLTIRSDHGPSKCIIDGEGTTMCINGNRGVSVYGVTFANGHVGNGGVVYRASAYQCVFLDCVVLGNGGVAYEGQNIFDCVFDNCISGRLGVVSGCPSIKRCLFRNCRAANPGSGAGAIIDSGADVDSCVFESCGNGAEYILIGMLPAGTTKNCLFLNIPAETGTGKCIATTGKVLECAFVGCGARTSMFVDNDDIERNVFLPMPANTKVSNIERTFSSNVVNGNVLFGGSSATTVQPITGNVVSGVISIPAGSPAKVAGNMTNVQSLPPFWGGPGGMPEMPSDPGALIAKFPMLSGIGPSWMLGGGVKYKPYDAVVEYLESTGTQWIDTGIIPGNTTGMVLDAMLLQRGGSTVIAGSRTSGTDTRFWINPSSSVTGQPLMAFGFGTVNIGDGAYQLDEWFQMSLNYENSRSGRYLSYSVQLPTFPGNPFSIYLFAANVSGTPTFAATSTCRIYGAKITLGSTIVRDFIPVRVGSGANAVGCLYDRANPTGGPLGNGLYPNAGTGSFIIGPDLG